LTPIIRPIGVSLPTPNARTPQTRQNQCSLRRLLNRYWVSTSCPDSKRKPSSRATAGQKRVRRQIEQLQR
jgi:hypothetical protein